MYSTRFEKWVAWLLLQETEFVRGHYGDFNYAKVDQPSGDPGGTTKFGIDQRSHPSTNIAKLTVDQAVQIYWWEYWTPCGAENMPMGWGEVLADIKVNGGDGPRMMQRAINASVPRGAQLVVDGRIGPLTVNAANIAGHDGLRVFLAMRQARFNRLSAGGMSRYLKGWTRRNDALASFVGVA